MECLQGPFKAVLSQILIVLLVLFFMAPMAVSSQAISKAELDCIKVGGIWAIIGADRDDKEKECNLPTLDQNKVCNSGSDCESYCVAPDSVVKGTVVPGKCFSWTIPVGHCLNVVEGGTSQGVICFD